MPPPFFIGMWILSDDEEAKLMKEWEEDSNSEEGS